MRVFKIFLIAACLMQVGNACMGTCEESAVDGVAGEGAEAAVASVRVRNLAVPTVVNRAANIAAVLEINPLGTAAAGNITADGVAGAATAGGAGVGVVAADGAAGDADDVAATGAAAEQQVLEAVSLTLTGIPRSCVKRVSLMYTGTMSPLLKETASQAVRMHYYYYGASQDIFADDAYAIELASARPDRNGNIVLKTSKPQVEGTNWLYINVELKNIRDITAKYDLRINDVVLTSRRSVALHSEGPAEHRIAIGLRNHGDDGVHTYRIPGLVTTPKGTLIAVYDIRYHTPTDLQEDIDVGMSRSTDGGRTWEKMKVIMDMGEWGGLPNAQNGIGDPAVLVDENTGEIFVVAVWTHGLGNARAWDRVGDGFTPQETAQLMIVSSKDDGKTWSEPRNITTDVKQQDWRFTLQGPGRGITMSDGTLVFPIQYIAPDKIPNAGIMYSKDHGLTWHCHGHAWRNTTESQVAEIAPGVLMLNMRNNHRTGRIVCTTTDLGRTWAEHPSSGKLREPVCMASLLQVPAAENITGRDILLFSNPDTEKGRNHMTIKASLDAGHTWSPENSLLLDEGEGWGYSSLTMIDPATVGILYEGSVSQLLFQAIPLTDILQK